MESKKECSDGKSNFIELLSTKIAMQIYPENWIESSGVVGFKVDNNAGKRAVAKEVAAYFLTLQEGCTHNKGFGLCDECLKEVGMF